MVRLEDVLVADGEEQSLRNLIQKNGGDPLAVLLDVENKMTIRRALETLLKELNSTQQQILLMIAMGYSTTAIAKEVNRTHATIIGCKRNIGKRLFNVADEERIDTLKKQLEQTRVKGRRYQKTLEEYERRYSVREALKDLFASLVPTSYSTSRSQYNSRPTSLFERYMNVVVGYREGVENGRKVVKPVKECRLRHYLAASFKDDKTVCTLCKKCAKK